MSYRIYSKVRQYRIRSKAGNYHGIWEGSTPAEALLAMHRDAGYSSAQVWLEDGRLAFAGDDTPPDEPHTDYRTLLGDVGDWDIEQL